MNRVDSNQGGASEIPEKWKGLDIISMSDSEIEELIDDMYKAKRIIRLPIPFLPETHSELSNMFHCHRCGECCIGGADGIFLFPDDIARLSKAMQISKNRFRKRYTFIAQGRRLLTFPCPFYDSKSHSCNIYEFRPINCQLFPFYSTDTPTAPINLSPLTSRIGMTTINSLCPEGRRIACRIIKLQRDALYLNRRERTRLK